jgi:hypothetical protein
VSRVNVAIQEPGHPHEGCSGYINESEEGTITVHTILGKEAVKVELDRCNHGGGACFVFQRPGALRVDRRGR